MGVRVTTEARAPISAIAMRHCAGYGTIDHRCARTLVLRVVFGGCNRCSAYE
jgi:hypothetical protein